MTRKSSLLETHQFRTTLHVETSLPHLGAPNESEHGAVHRAYAAAAGKNSSKTLETQRHEEKVGEEYGILPPKTPWP